ncbi:MAG: DUF1987 domain-containing protein [Desulfobacteraceae bacterium]|nr:DUF1987 domain-containing protein [Desulfobacteraceae bacterium]
MENFEIKASKYIPEILLDCEANVLHVKGKSYPENTAEFYEPVFIWLEQYFEQLDTQQVVVNIELSYFNSSSSKVFMDIFDMLDEAVENGKNITLNWIYDEEDDTMLEYGEEFREELESLPFNFIKK